MSAFLRVRYTQIILGNSFFTKVATVYVLVGEDDAKLAAVAAGMGASEKDREHMHAFLTTLTDSFQAQRGAWMKQIERATALTQAIGGSGGALSTAAFEVRDALRRANEDYSKALRAGDADVFVRRYPQLFGREAGAAIAVGQHPDAGRKRWSKTFRPKTMISQKKSRQKRISQGWLPTAENLERSYIYLKTGSDRPSPTHWKNLSPSFAPLSIWAIATICRVNE